MLCGDCGKPIVDTARFCSFCGAQQRAAPSSQPVAGETSRGSAPPTRASEPSDVTVILPRRRVVELVAEAAQRNDAFAPAAAPAAPEPPTVIRPPRRSRVPAIAIGGAAAVVIIGVLVAIALHTGRSPPEEKVVEAPARASAPIAPPIPESAQRNEAAAVPAPAEPPGVPSTEAALAVEAPPAASPVPPAEPTPQVEAPTHPALTPSKEAVARKNRRTVPVPPPEPAPVPVETPPPQPVEVAAPAPVPIAPSPPPAPKVEKVACAEVENPFSREVCLWQECAKPEFRSHAECARFTGPGNQR